MYTKSVQKDYPFYYWIIPYVLNEGTKWCPPLTMHVGLAHEFENIDTWSSLLL